MKLGDQEHFKLHPDDQGVDRIEIDVVPRFKTSGLSGDEWRVSGRILMFRKGELVGERSMSNIESCVNALPWLWMTLPEWTKGPLYSGERGGKCQQAGCSEPAEVTYRLKQEWSARGDGPLPANVLGQPLRRFCSAHGVRGDCGLEDADDNYERVSGPPASRGNIPPEDVSPSRRVEISIDRIEDLPAAVQKVADDERKRREAP